jgi:hypothetical protein
LPGLGFIPDDVPGRLLARSFEGPAYSGLRGGSGNIAAPIAPFALIDVLRDTSVMPGSLPFAL